MPELRGSSAQKNISEDLYSLWCQSAFEEIQSADIESFLVCLNERLNVKYLNISVQELTTMSVCYRCEKTGHFARCGGLNIYSNGESSPFPELTRLIILR